MKKQMIVFTIIAAAMTILTGCGEKTNMTIQNETVPVVTAASDAERTEMSSMTVSETSAAATNENVVLAAAAGTTYVSDKSTGAGTTVTQNTSANGTEKTGETRNENDLYGKWETVSFSKDSGESVAYDFSDAVHRSYYVALDLNRDGQSGMTVGTESHPATFMLNGSRLTVGSVSRFNPVTMEFTVSEDKTRMTVELPNGRIIATLKRISTDFSIRKYQTAEPDIGSLAGEWYYEHLSQTSNDTYDMVSLLKIEPDGSFRIQDMDGSEARNGQISVSYAVNPDDSKTPYYDFRIYGNSVFVLFCDQTGDARFLNWERLDRIRRRDLESTPELDYIGCWEYGDCTIQIGKNGEVFEAEVRQSSDIGHNTIREEIWNYNCRVSNDGTALECSGSGTLKYVDNTADIGTVSTDVYSDGSAVFKLKGSVLSWQDMKEDKGRLKSFQQSNG